MIETEPVTEANAGAATSGPDISEEEHEVVLNEEVPVVEKTTQPVERVRLGTETTTDEETVTEEVRKEHIEAELELGEGVDAPVRCAGGGTEAGEIDAVGGAEEAVVAVGVLIGALFQHREDRAAVAVR